MLHQQRQKGIKTDYHRTGGGIFDIYMRIDMVVLGYSKSDKINRERSVPYCLILPCFSWFVGTVYSCVQLYHHDCLLISMLANSLLIKHVND